MITAAVTFTLRANKMDLFKVHKSTYLAVMIMKNEL